MPTSPKPYSRDLRVLILTPIGRDAALVARRLEETGFDCKLCESMSTLCHEVENGCGMIILTQEVLSTETLPALQKTLAEQPRWSDIPLQVLTSGGSETPANSEALAALSEVGNVTLIERPVRIATLLSTVNSALRARNRQYDVRDHLTEEIQNKQALAHSEERLRVALDAAELGAWRRDWQSNNVECTPQCKAHFGYAPDAEFTYEMLLGMVYHEDRERMEAAVAEAVEQHSAYRCEYRIRCPDGNLRWILASGRAYYDAAGVPTSLAGVTLDITHRKTAEQERERLLESERKARAEAETASRLKDEFLATLSHELRTPLTAILGWTQMLRTGPLDEILAAGALETIERNARSQAQLIEDLLDVSRIVSGKLRFEMEQVEPLQVVQKAIEVVHPSADAKNIAIDVSAPESRVLIAADADRLQQVVWNLLCNAVKFTPTGGRVDVNLEYSADAVTIAVRDTGKGIAPEFLPHVFDRFRQADQTSTRTYGGLGLGLSIVQQITQLHGGTVRAESEGEGRGATFSVELPISKTAQISRESGHESGHERNPESDPATEAAPGEVRAPAEEQTSALSTQSTRPDAAQQLQHLRVLVVEDEKDTRDLVVAILEQHGAQVRSAASATQALDVWKASPPDILVSDIGMPGEDGYSLLTKLRNENHDSKTIPAIALTAYAREEDRARVLAHGFQMHIAKPIEAAHLVSIIANLTKDSRA